MISRTTDDYEGMARAGVVAVIEPSFWLGQPRTSLGSYVAIRKVTYDNALAVYGLSGAMKESDWTMPVPIDQRSLFQGNSVLRGGQAPCIEAPRRSMNDLRIS